MPRPLSDNSKWKASEWRSWLLFYILACLQNVLPDPVLHHTALLVRSMYTLLQSTITDTELNVCEYDLTKFVGMFQVFYGSRYMTFNVHTLLHTVNSVRKTGPLWATSAFPYESMIFQLKKHVHGPDGIMNQIANKHIAKFDLQLSLEKATNSDVCKEFCGNLFSHADTINAVNVNLVSDDATAVLIGKSNNVNIKDFDYFETCDQTKELLSYSRCIYKKTVFHGMNYNRVERTNDTVVTLKSGMFVEIQQFLKLEDKCFVEVVEFHVTKLTFETYKKINFENMQYDKNSECTSLKMNHIFIVEKYGKKFIVSVNEITDKCLFFTCNEIQYICTIPNKFEIQ